MKAGDCNPFDPAQLPEVIRDRVLNEIRGCVYIFWKERETIGNCLVSLAWTMHEAVIPETMRKPDIKEHVTAQGKLAPQAVREAFMRTIGYIADVWPSYGPLLANLCYGMGATVLNGDFDPPTKEIRKDLTKMRRKGLKYEKAAAATAR